jgi:hypothetical protein
LKAIKIQKFNFLIEMKKTGIFKALLSFIAFMLLVAVAAPVVEQALGVNPIVTTIVAPIVFAVAVVAGRKAESMPAVRMGVEVEVWVNYIIERFWADNKFLQFAHSDDDKVLAGKLVHIPQPGQRPTVTKNRTVFPATAIRRADTDVVYTLDEYTTDPTHIQDAEKVELSYDKIDSVYGDHAGQLVEDVAEDAINRWLMGIPQSSILKTSGGSTSMILQGATGNRKVFIHENLRQAKRIMDGQNVPSTDRYALLSSNHMDELITSLSSTQYKDFSLYVDAKAGVVGELYGFKLMHRSFVALAEADNSDLIIKPWGAEVETTTRDVSFCWQKSAVARAMGDVKFFENPDRAEYYGDVYSALLRFGGRRRREDNKGIVAIIQDNA